MTWSPVLGKYGRTRGGQMVGPIEKGEQYEHGPWRFRAGNHYFDKNGIAYPFGDGEEKPSDLVAEWVDDASPDPVRVVTRHEIVPGMYGPFHIGAVASSGLVRVQLSTNPVFMTAEAFREAAHVFTRIADALEANRKQEKTS